METPIKLLLMEDNPGDARIILELLRESKGLHFNMDRVEQLSAGLKRLAEGAIDLILLDLNLPDSQGLDTVMRTIEQARDVPIVVLTGLDDEELATGVMRAGAQDYLVKGQMDADLLKRTIRYAIERASAESALQQSEHFLQSVFDGIQDGISVLDCDFNIIRVNTWMEKKYEEQMPLVGEKCYRAYQKRESQCVNCPSLHTLKTGKPGVEIVPYISTNRPRGWIELSSFPLMGPNGEIKGIIEHVKDITSRKQTEEERERLQSELRQAQKLESIGTLAGGIAHDFNNLLMAVQGNVSLALLEMNSEGACCERLKNIEEQIRNGARLTSLLLGYARQGKYEIKPVALNQAVEQVSETFRRTRKEITVHQKLSQDLFLIEADPGQIEQVLLNLYLNASDAMKGRGDLIIRTLNTTHTEMKGKLYNPKPGAYVCLTVTDTGTGMDKETMERIFEPFFTTKEMGHGTGLGLASVYGIIKGHGGYIDVESEKGMGTTFNVYLPASNRGVTRGVKPAEKLLKGNETVLFVDDEVAIRQVGRDMLRAMGYTVLLAEGGGQAVELYSREWNDIDIVLLDAVMPKMSGSETYNKLQEINPHVKVLLFSGYSADGQPKQILQQGCSGFMQKPFNMRELSMQIRRILDNQARS